MATAAKVVIVEVEELVDELDPDNIHIPSVYVDRVLVSNKFEKRIERRTFDLG